MTEHTKRYYLEVISLCNKKPVLPYQIRKALGKIKGGRAFITELSESHVMAHDLVNALKQEISDDIATQRLEENDEFY